MKCPFTQFEWCEGMRLPMCGLIPSKICEYSECDRECYDFAKCVKETLEAV
jgi:hypothetical protein